MFLCRVIKIASNLDKTHFSFYGMDV
jgi:hypothetical protein